MSKKYRLLKDLPDCRMGAEVVWDEEMGAFYYEKTCFIGGTCHKGRNYLTKGTVMSTQFFEEIKEPERIEIDYVAYDNMNKCYWFQTGGYKEFSKDKFPAIKQAIERVLNDDPIKPEENKSNDSFQWTDELVKEYCEWDKTRIHTSVDPIYLFKGYHTPKPQAEKVYDKNFGDDKLCECGHPYYRHFDSYENMSPVGCKYCPCDSFKEKQTPQADMDKAIEEEREKWYNIGKRVSYKLSYQDYLNSLI